MESIIVIEGTATTPHVKFDLLKGRFEIKGRSLSDHALKFYKPLFDSIDRYIVKPVSPTVLEFHFEYINNESSKCILDLLKRLEGLPKRGIKVDVNWYYKSEGDYMKEAGADYKSIIRLDVNVLKEFSH